MMSDEEWRLMTRVLLVLTIYASLFCFLFVGGCTAPPAPVPPTVIPPRPAVPANLRACAPAVPPPPVPGLPRTVEQLARYANDEARARWITAERLATCGWRLRQLNEWIEEQDDGLAGDLGALGELTGVDPQRRDRPADGAGPGLAR